jgi:hypothetical protein
VLTRFFSIESGSDATATPIGLPFGSLPGASSPRVGSSAVPRPRIRIALGAPLTITLIVALASGPVPAPVAISWAWRFSREALFRVIVKSAVEPDGGVTRSAARFQAVTVAVVAPAAEVKLLTPSDRTAPTGTPSILT